MVKWGSKKDSEDPSESARCRGVSFAPGGPAMNWKGQARVRCRKGRNGTHHPSGTCLILVIVQQY